MTRITFGNNFAAFPQLQNLTTAPANPVRFQGQDRFEVTNGASVVLGVRHRARVQTLVNSWFELFQAAAKEIEGAEAITDEQWAAAKENLSASLKDAKEED